MLLAACAGDGNPPALEIGDPVEPPASAAAATLAVARVVTGNPPRRDVVLVSTEGRPVRRLAAGATGFGGLAWSPDGRRVAYARATAEDAYDLHVGPADGRGGARRLTSTGDALAPVWAPDGRTIVYLRLARRRAAPPHGAIWAVGTGGGTPRRLTPTRRRTLDLPTSFSPDGERLAVTTVTWRRDGRPARRAIRVLDVATLETRLVVDDAEDGAFSPDGKRLAYASARDRNGTLSYGDSTRFANELYVLDDDGARRLTRTPDLNEGAPSWSPDGRLIAYHRGQVTGNAEARSVFTVRPDGTCNRLVVGDPGLAVWYAEPAWRPARVAAARLPCRARAAPTPLVPLAGNMSLAQAARFRPFTLYWLGRRFDRYVLSAISRDAARGPGGRGPVVSLAYGALDLQIWPACARVPAHVAGRPDARAPVRGVEAVFFEGGYRLEIVTGRATVVAFGPRRLLLRAAQSLRPVGAARPAPTLPPPVPGAVERRLRCGRGFPGR